MLRGTVNRNARLRWPALTGLLGWAVTAVMAEPSDSASAPTTPSIPFEFVSGRVLVSGRINDARSATLMLDTGYSVNMLSRELVDSLELKRIGHITIVGVAGEETADQFEGVTFSLGAASYKSRRVAALPPSYQRHWRKRDGVLGAGFFRRLVVEIDPKRSTVRLQEPETDRYSGDGETVPSELM